MNHRAAARVLLLLVLALSLAPRPARADDRKARTEINAYGAPIVVADLGAAAIVVLSLGSSGGLIFGGTVYLVVGPAVHMVHNRPGAAMASLALRAGLPTAGFHISYYRGASLKALSDSLEFAALSALVAVVMDQLLAIETVKVAPRVEPSQGRYGAELTVSF